MLAMLLFPSPESTISVDRVAGEAGVLADEPYSGNSDELSASPSAREHQQLHRES